MNAPSNELSGHVVIGTDGSDQATRALDQAIVEAQRRGVPLEIVHGWPWGGAYEPTDDAEAVVKVAAQRVAAQDPDVHVVVTVVDDEAAEVLVRRSAHAALAVVGTRGHGGFATLLLGSVSLRVAAHCRSPLMVVRGDNDLRPPGLGTVALGIGGEADAGATAFAFEEATRRGARLAVTHAWIARRPATGESAGQSQADLEQRTRQEEAVPDQVMAELRAKHPQVRVDVNTVRGPAEPALIKATREADVMVIAAHRRKKRLGLQLEPVTHALLQHSHCPVTLIPASGDDAEHS